MLIDPHPDDFVEDGLAAPRDIRGIDSKNFGFVYGASHTFYMGNTPLEIMRAAGDKLQLVHVSDTWTTTVPAASATSPTRQEVPLLRLAGHVLIEQHDEWDGADRGYFSEHSMKLLTDEPGEVAISELIAA